MKKFSRLVMSIGLMVCLCGCGHSQSEKSDDIWQKVDEAEAVNSGAEEAESNSSVAKASVADADLYKDFLESKAPAILTFEGQESEVWFKDLPQDPEEWDSYSVSDEMVDLDNDGKTELILNGPYGGMYLDERAGKYFVLAQGEGTTGELSYVYYEGKTYIIHRDTSHGGRQSYLFDCYNGDGEVTDSFDLTAEYWDSEYDFYDSDSDFTFRGQKITMDEYEKLMKDIFNHPTKAEFGAEMATTEFDYDDGSEKIVNDASDTFYDAMEAFYGEYTYKKDCDGLEGSLAIIQEFDNSREYSIYDNNSNGYRFIALGSNVEYIKGNKFYMKYPETAYEDGTEVFKYYVFANHGAYLIIFETDENYENPEYIYTAWHKF